MQHKVFEGLEFLNRLLRPFMIPVVHPTRLKIEVGRNQSVPRVSDKGELEIAFELRRIRTLILRIGNMPRSRAKQRLRDTCSSSLWNVYEYALVVIGVAGIDAATA